MLGREKSETTKHERKHSSIDHRRTRLEIEFIVLG